MVSCNGFRDVSALAERNRNARQNLRLALSIAESALPVLVSDHDHVTGLSLTVTRSVCAQEAVKAIVESLDRTAAH
eukprot:3076348-Rhodomonas_salina.1